MRKLLLLGVVAVLGACGGATGRAVSACEAAIAEKTQDKKFAIDTSDMAAKAQPEADNIIRIQSGIVFDPGMPREAKQTFECRVRVADGKADVISLQFIW